MEYTDAQLQMWDKAKDILGSQMNTGPYRTWILPSRLHAVKGDTILFEVPDVFALQSIQGRYLTMLSTAVERAFGRKYNLIPALEGDIRQQLENISHSMLSERYSFDNFVVGTSNRFAYSASMAVAEACATGDPEKGYNPLFIYGGVGLGKTHLMNAIGNYITENAPRKNVLFISSEAFTNEFIDALKNKGTSDLREKMRNADVFMVDDIQFLSKTVATQEEFFHTFNDLHSKGKQIIMSSDRPHNEIPTIEERLRSRFAWGLTVDIRKPDLETRMAILRRKCEDEGIDCEGNVLEFIADRVENNIRVLEGALNRLKAHSKLIGERITLEFARETLEETLPTKQPAVVTADKILAAVADRYAITPDDLASKKRNREFILPRQIAMLLMRDMLSMSTTAIGRELGDRDHTTVMHGCEKIANSMKDDPTFKRNVDELRESILEN